MEGDVIMQLVIKLTEQEKEIAESYAYMHSLSIEEAFKQALFEKIEDEYDLKVYEEVYREYQENPITYSFDELMSELGL